MKRTNRVAWGMAAVLAWVALFARGAGAEKLYPVDEGPRDPSFLAFRNRLIAAVRRHDVRFINSILDPHVTSSFGDEETIAAFRRNYEGKHREAKLWKELLTVLSLGGQFVFKHEFCAPYVYSGTLDIDDPHYDLEVVIGKNVRVRMRPSEASSVVDTLSYDIVDVDHGGSVPPNSDNPIWVKITTPSGHKGYVASQYIRDPIDYRACFKKRRGRWWLTAFVAGD